MSQEERQQPWEHANRVIFFWTCLVVYSGVVAAAIVVARKRISFDDLSWAWPIVLIVLLAAVLTALLLGRCCPVEYRDQSNNATR